MLSPGHGVVVMTIRKIFRTDFTIFQPFMWKNKAASHTVKPVKARSSVNSQEREWHVEDEESYMYSHWQLPSPKLHP